MTVDFPCLDCGDLLRIEMKDGQVLNEEAREYITYVSVPFWKWFDDSAHA